MGEVSTIGLDIAKSVFQVHGIDGAGAVVIRKRISRAKVLEFFAQLPAIPGRERGGDAVGDRPTASEARTIPTTRAYKLLETRQSDPGDEPDKPSGASGKS